MLAVRKPFSNTPFTRSQDLRLSQAMKDISSNVPSILPSSLRCLGTTQHLKGKYGGGYVLEVKLNPGQAFYSMDHASGEATRLLEKHLSALDRRIREVFPSVELAESFGERVTYKIPSQAVRALSTVFAALEQGECWVDVSLLEESESVARGHSSAFLTFCWSVFALCIS